MKQRRVRMAAAAATQQFSYIRCLLCAVFLCNFFVSLFLSLWERFGPLPNLFSIFFSFQYPAHEKKGNERISEKTKEPRFARIRPRKQSRNKLNEKCWTNWQKRDTHKNQISAACAVTYQLKNKGRNEKERQVLLQRL